MAAIAMAYERVILAPEPEPFELTGNLRAPGRDADGAGNVAEDVSGIACIRTAPDRRRCLLVNDEGGKAQFLTIEGRRIEPKRRVALIGKAPSPDTLGRAPAERGCGHPEPVFKEFDGEGVAYAEPYFYVVGSHGCARRADAVNLSAMMLARIRVDEQGKPADAPEVETTYRLGDALARAETVKDFYLKSLMTANGLNIEGLAVVGGLLYAGLRAPSLEGRAFLVVVPVEPLFAAGHAPYAGTPEVIPLAVGEGAGIRDLSVLEDGRLLVLTGPAQDQPVPYRLFRFDPKKPADLALLGELAPLGGSEARGKAEAITVLGRDRVLVFFDSLPNGAPRAYRVPGLSDPTP